MKKLIITSILAVLIASVTTVRAQDYPEEYLGLPGDNLNLYAVMDLFRNSRTLEGFERSLNDQDSRINNLDLNGDNRVDYITVTDYRKSKVHTIVLRAILGRNDYQDVAVFTVEKLRRKKVMIQLIGDESLYGRNYIIEPVYSRKPNPGFYADPLYADNVSVINNYYYDTFDWPVVVYIYNPHYSGWHSSWYWGYYPDYWNPWRPYYWDFYYGYYSGWYPQYYSHYQHWDYPRYHHYNDYYYHGIREYSPQVAHRISEGNYRDTYSRPDQRSEGVALYISTHATRTGEAHDNAGVNTQGRRVSAPQTNSGQADASGTDTDRRTAASTATDRRTPATVSSRPTTSTSAAQGTGETRRETPQSAAATRSSVQSRTEDIRAAESKAAEARAAESRAAESKAAEARANEARATEARAAEAKRNEAARKSTSNSETGTIKPIRK